MSEMEYVSNLPLTPTKENIQSTLQNDVLKRQESLVHFLLQLSRADGPLFISLDAPWGSGKTFFVKQAIALIEEKDMDLLLSKNLNDKPSDDDKKAIHDIIPVYYDAWRNDSETDPILSILHEVKETVKSCADFPERLNFKKPLSDIFSTALAAGLGFPIDKIIKSVKEAYNNLGPFAIYEKQYEARKKLNASIKEFCDEIRLSQCHEMDSDKKKEELEKKKIVIFIDELDRCRPDFAVLLLERLKHYIVDSQIIFVFSTNLIELQHMVRNVYGIGFDGERYLDRFFDMHMTLPQIQRTRLFDLLELGDSGFRDQSIRAAILFFNMSLRECVRYLMWCKMAIPKRELGFSSEERRGGSFCVNYMLPYMIALKLIKPSEYQLYIDGDDTAIKHFMEFLLKVLDSEQKRAYFFVDEHLSQDEEKNMETEFRSKVQDLAYFLWRQDRSIKGISSFDPRQCNIGNMTIDLSWADFLRNALGTMA